MENVCHFVASRSILKSCHFHSHNPSSSCNNDTYYLNNMIQSNNMFDGMSIYVCSDLLNFFVSKILPNIKNNFVLVSGDSDLITPLESLTKDNYDLLINCTLLIHWFAQNTRIQYDSKIIQLPIGLDYHTIENNSNHEWKMEKENHLTHFQEEILLNIRKTMKPFNERINKIYINFSKIMIDLDKENRR